MVYLGGKAKIAKYIVPFLQNIINEKGIKTFISPFCGGVNIEDKIQCETIVASDLSYYLIEMWKALQDGWRPPLYLDEMEYLDIKHNPLHYSPQLVGTVGYLASFGTKWFGGYGRSKGRDPYNEKIRNLIKQVDSCDLSKILFIHSDYRNLDVALNLRGIEYNNSLLYCDPPYKGTVKYKVDFDHNFFYDWCRWTASRGITIVISEYSMPSDFKCVMEIPHSTNFASQRNNKVVRIEKLFVMR